MSLIDSVLRFFGLKEELKDESYSEALHRLSSSKKMEDVRQLAFKAVLSKDEIISGQPHSDETNIKVECLMVDAKIAEHYRGILKTKFSDAEYLSNLMDVGLNNELDKFSSRSISVKLQANVGENQGEANRLNKLLSDSNKELVIFKGAHGLKRAAKFPISRANSFYIIATLGICEAIANSIFLQNSNSTTVALILALGIAAINIIGNAWFGYKYREKNHTDQRIAKIGKNYFIFAILLILIVNIVIAVYRYADSELSNSFYLESFVLFSIGIGLGIGAFQKGYKLDDEFPSFGELTRKVQELETQLAELKEEHAKHTNTLIEQANESLNKLSEKIVSTSAQFESQLPDIALQIKIWEQEFDSLSESYIALINLYRTVFVANHPKGSLYPQKIVGLEKNRSLTTVKEQVDNYLNQKNNLRGKVEELKIQVEGAKISLSNWINSSEGQKLINFI